MPRILPRGEIESLDHTAIPRVLMPERRSVFATRAARLRQLAPDHPMTAYLTLMAHLADAQQHALSVFSVPAASQERIELAQSHGMPPLQATGWQRNPVWRDILRALLDHIASAPGVPAQAIAVATDLKARLNEDPDTLEALADALLAEREQDVDCAAAPFVMAALQVYWTDLACSFDKNQLPVVSPFGVCPTCGSLPVAGVVHVGGQQDGCRYMGCSLCATEWHLVRVTCSHCEDTKDIAYHFIEDGSQAIKAESCDHCHTYRKIFYQEKDLYVEPVADDLASLTLDIMMGEEGYARASGNPLLWQHTEG